jgi:hypothetical protein
MPKQQPARQPFTINRYVGPDPAVWMKVMRKWSYGAWFIMGDGGVCLFGSVLSLNGCNWLYSS